MMGGYQPSTRFKFKKVVTPKRHEPFKWKLSCGGDNIGTHIIYVEIWHRELGGTLFKEETNVSGSSGMAVYSTKRVCLYFFGLQFM